MIGLDTNILIRFLTQDDPQQTPVAVNIMQSRLTEEEPGFVSLVVLAEVAWVLHRVYRYPYQEIGRALIGLAQSPVIRLESELEAFVAIQAAAQNGAELADVLIGELAKAAGCSVTLTFDAAASKLPGFELAK